MTFSIPDDWLVDKVKYAEFLGVNRSHKRKFADYITVEKVRVQRRHSFNRSGADTTLNYVMKVFIYKKSEPFIEIKEQSKMKVDGEEFTVSEVAVFSDIYSDEKIIQEVELI